MYLDQMSATNGVSGHCLEGKLNRIYDNIINFNVNKFNLTLSSYFVILVKKKSNVHKCQAKVNNYI